MSDPAAIVTSLSISGLDTNEAAVVLGALPAGCSATFEVTQPALGGPRYAVALHNLSTVQARDLLTARIEASEAAWNSGPDTHRDDNHRCPCGCLEDQHGSGCMWHERRAQDGVRLTADDCPDCPTSA